MKAQKLIVVSLPTKRRIDVFVKKWEPRVSTSAIAIFKAVCNYDNYGCGLQTLNIQVEQMEDKVFKGVLTKIRDDIGGSANLSDAMSKFPVFLTHFTAV